MTQQTREADVDTDRDGSFGSLGSILVPLVLAWSAYLALLPLNDNSFFTHLATGRLILEDGQVPSADPYTFTAAGEPWTVQSWLASVAYATAERMGGVVGLRILVLAIFLAAGLALWALSRPAASVLVRLGVVALAMAVATSAWSERPYMVAVIGLAVILLALEGRLAPWLLVPLTWIWVNSHGSYPLALLMCLAVLVGTWLEQRAGCGPSSGLRVELRTSVAVTVGVGLGAASPLGLEAWLFPLRSITRSSSFAQIREWQAPDFTSMSDRVFLVLVLGAIVAVASKRRWRYALPLLVFAASAVLARRNIVMAIPVVVLALAHAAPRVGTLRSGTVPSTGRVLAILTWTTVPLVVANGISDVAPLGLGGYPVAALSFVDSHSQRGMVITQDFAGNLLEVLDGPKGAVFVDDRADMFRPAVLEDYGTLNRAEPAWSAVLRRHDASTVVWERSHPLGSLLSADPRWRVEYSDSEWLVARRR